MELAGGQQVDPRQPVSAASLPENIKQRGQSKYQRAKEQLAREARAINNELEQLQQRIEEREQALLANKEKQAALDDEHKQHEARLFKQLNVHGPSLPAASSDNSEYDTAEENAGQERQQNGHAQSVEEASSEADNLALPPGLSMGGPSMHNLPDEVIGFESDEEPMAASEQQGPATHELQMGAAAGSQFQGDRMLAQTAASGHNNRALEHRPGASARQPSQPSQSTWTNGNAAGRDDGWAQASPEKGAAWGVGGPETNGAQQTSAAEQSERPVRRGPPGFTPGQTFSPDQKRRPPGFTRALTEATSERSRGAKIDLRDRLNRGQDFKTDRGMENGITQPQEATNPFQLRTPQQEVPTHPMLPSKQEVLSAEPQSRGRALRPDMPVYSGPRTRQSVTPDYSTPPASMPPSAARPAFSPEFSLGMPAAPYPRSPLENGHGGGNGRPGEQMAAHAAQGSLGRPMETLRAPGQFTDRTPSSDARGRSQDRRPPSLPRVRPVSSAASSQQEDGGSQAGFVPLDSLQRPAKWADDGEDEGSPFIPHPPIFPSSASGSSSLQNGHAQPASPVKDWSEQFPGLTLGGHSGAAGGRQANGHAPPPPDLAAAQDFPSLAAAPAAARGGTPRAASPASALTPATKASAWSNGGGAAISRNLLAQQSYVSLGTPAAATAPKTSKPEVEAVELQRNLRVAGDDADDKARKRQCRSKVDFELWEKVRGRDTNTVSGLELHTSVLSPLEQVRMVETIERWVASGKRGELQGRTFSAPRRSMPGKG
ncbi:hypothetical protein WJX84_008875, partial [Apatococcus fuscideae]